MAGWRVYGVRVWGGRGVWGHTRPNEQAAVLAAGAGVDVELLQRAAAARHAAAQRPLERQRRVVRAPARVQPHLERSPRAAEVAVEAAAGLVGEEALALRERAAVRAEDAVLVLRLEPRQRLHHLHVLLHVHIAAPREDRLPAGGPAAAAACWRRAAAAHPHVRRGRGRAHPGVVPCVLEGGGGRAPAAACAQQSTGFGGRDLTLSY